MSIADLPSEMLVEIATYLGTTRNLANFKMTCRRIYNAIESKNVNRKRLPHLKFQEIEFSDYWPSKIEVRYGQQPRRRHGKRPNKLSFGRRCWNHSDPLSTKLHILIQHWILEDNCRIKFSDGNIFEIPLLNSLLEIRYGNSVQCEIRGCPSNSENFQEALPFIHKFLKKVSCLLKCFSDFIKEKSSHSRKGFLYEKNSIMQ